MTVGFLVALNKTAWLARIKARTGRYVTTSKTQPKQLQLRPQKEDPRVLLMTTLKAIPPTSSSYFSLHSHSAWFTYLLTYSMEQSPWEANRFSASQKIPRIFCNPKVHYAFTRARHLFLSSASSIESIPPHSTSGRSILTLYSHSRLCLPSGLFLSGFSAKTLYTLLLSPHTRYMPRPSHSSGFDHPNNIWWRVQVTKLLIM